MENKHPKIFLISGKARNGKDTITDFIINEYQKRSKKAIRLAFGDYIKMYAKKISDWDGREETKPRELLQNLGTELIRNEIDELFFVKRICDDIRVYSYFFDVLVVSDVRMKNEIEIPERLFDNVIKINIVRPNLESPLTESQQHHQTECDLDNYNNYDKIVVNDGTLEELEKKIEKLIEVIEDEY